MGYVKEDDVNLHPVEPGDTIELSDATWEVVKTNHTENSVGYIVRKSESIAYLVDSYVPPKATVDKLKGIDTLVLDATLDEYLLKTGDERWLHFSVPEAVKFWKEVGADTCILSHLACHRYMNGVIVAGFSESERLEYESKHSGLKFAYDGMRIQLL